MISFPFINKTPHTLSPQNLTVKFPRDPKIAATPTKSRTQPQNRIQRQHTIDFLTTTICQEIPAMPSRAALFLLLSLAASLAFNNSLQKPTSKTSVKTVRTPNTPTLHLVERRDLQQQHKHQK
jgi:hypothetical protein